MASKKSINSLEEALLSQNVTFKERKKALHDEVNSFCFTSPGFRLTTFLFAAE
jgi:hypothetical protein